MSYKVFLTHNVGREDYSLVVQITNLLWQQGIEVFVPEWFPRYPEAVNRQVAAQINNSDLVLAIVTSSTSRPSYMYQEIGYARSRDKNVVALVEQGINAEGFLYDASKIFFSRFVFEDAAREIVRHIDGLKGKKEAQQKTVLGLALGGLFLWWLSQRGRPREDEQP